ncbi:acetate kinase [Caldicellulosiruptor saccharolyticus DSM 8903]|uniref:Acetate kinase n=1 Tax=Caldicellulosiruptor saccharolyticus (strain ATCC 43494 / DSM 8903 / Tp8T 6331) TaxID=351627 RepID=ACKA_CALS8|nr:acetate kinase [Caldicellulosiruptor saccharolyticus]A4XL40.1 RecName: Full=Acetate kinase; AltName: Full=Acetokinase [Caldicellulosiruptor saccharolyticus DSM 8903]ABP67625.1 acetate kinase [Caldicellulosiruptor saccharolyticus DSM 8903]
MKVLVLNSGSSSLKYQFIDTETEVALCKGVVDRIGLPGAFIRHQKNGQEIIKEQEVKDHNVAIKLVLEMLTHPQMGIIKSMDEIDAIGHRVVHGGEYFSDAVIVNEEVKKAIRECIEFAPLHNPANLMGIEACEKEIPGKPNVAVFDTAFHQTMPKYAYMYSLPYEVYEKYKIRKYGFHGTSHKYVAIKAAEYLKRPLKELKLITCHLGNGSSVCAIKYGKSVDTSMGFTPLAGLAMGTRSGTIDPAVILYLMEKENMDVKQMNDLLNKKSGVLGISGVSSDFRDLEKAANEGNERAQLAIDMFCYRVKKYIGEYAAVLGGVDAIIFTAGIGENNPIVREKCVTDLEYMGVLYDKQKNFNAEKGKVFEINKPESKVKVLIVPTNEELMIARETKRLLEK